jgi:hypothetical protein
MCIIHPRPSPGLLSCAIAGDGGTRKEAVGRGGVQKLSHILFETYQRSKSNNRVDFDARALQCRATATAQSEQLQPAAKRCRL